MTINEIFELCLEEHDFRTNSDSDYDLANSFAHDLASNGFSQVSIANFIVDKVGISDDDAIEIACRVAP